MADAATNLRTATVFNTATLSGRIDVSRMADGNTYTELTLPAPDEYSRPQTVEVKSKGSLGQRGSVVEVGVRIGGYGSNFEYADSKTGAIEKGRRVRIMLEAIES